MAPGVRGNGSIPLSHSGNIVMRTGIHTHTHTHNDLRYTGTPLPIISILDTEHNHLTVGNDLNNCSRNGKECRPYQQHSDLGLHCFGYTCLSHYIGSLHNSFFYLEIYVLISFL